MAYAIYHLKIQLLSQQFGMSIKERRGVKRLANFVTLYYTKAFLESRLAACSPANDLKFLSIMNVYKLGTQRQLRFV